MKRVAPTGKKRIGSVASAERGELVTVLYAVGASGVVMPPMFVFSRVNFRNNFIVGGPLGCIGGANKSDWMNEDLYVNFIKHFIHHVRSSKERPVLLILDNVDAHTRISPTAIDLARENGVVMLTIPPHTPHYLQPLDRTYYGPFKTAFGVAMDGWMRSHPGRIVTIYKVPPLVAEAQLHSLTIRNIQNGFRVSGIYPYNRNVFTDEDFAPAEVTNCPDMGIVDCASDINDQQDPRTQTISDPDELSEQESSNSTGQKFANFKQPSTSSTGSYNIPLRRLGKALYKETYVSPSQILPIPKAAARKNTQKGGRKRASSRVLTSTPVRDEIVVNKTNRQTKIKKTKKARKSLFCKVSSDSQSEVELVLKSGTCTEESDDEVIEGDFVVVKVEGKSRKVRYIAKVDTVDGDEFEGTFLKKVPQIVGHVAVFIINKTDIAAFQRNDVIVKLPKPVKNTGSTRKCNQLVFPVDITHWLN